VRERHGLLSRLRRDLTGWRENQSARAAIPTALQALDEGKEESCRLAASGLGGGNEVTAGKRKREYFPLNGRRDREAHPMGGPKKLGGEAELIEDRLFLAG
jgi:hypothetical protein